MFSFIIFNKLSFLTPSILYKGVTMVFLFFIFFLAPRLFHNILYPYGPVVLEVWDYVGPLYPEDELAT